MGGRLPDAPVHAPVALMRWEGIAFLHWAYPPDVVASRLPDGLVPQVLDGAAWVGLTPFVMRDVRPPGLPVPSRWTRFVEVNVRTYAHYPASGTDGLWFLTLLCDRAEVVTGLRAVGVPYRRASGHVLDAGDATRYRARGRAGGRLDARVVPGARIGRPEPWLTAVTGRWNAYAHRAGRLWRVPVEHAPWPLHAATVPHLATDLLEVCGLPSPAAPPHATWSPGVDVRVGVPRPLARR